MMNHCCSQCCSTEIPPRWCGVGIGTKLIGWTTLVYSAVPPGRMGNLLSKREVTSLIPARVKQNKMTKLLLFRLLFGITRTDMLSVCVMYGIFGTDILGVCAMRLCGILSTGRLCVCVT